LYYEQQSSELAKTTPKLTQICIFGLLILKVRKKEEIFAITAFYCKLD